jgi:hypothetical protein
MPPVPGGLPPIIMPRLDPTAVPSFEVLNQVMKDWIAQMLAQAQLSAQDRATVAQLVGQLASQRFRERQKAENALMAMKERILPTLLKALQESALAKNDPEVRHRLEETINSIREKYIADQIDKAMATLSADQQRKVKLMYGVSKGGGFPPNYHHLGDRPLGGNNR